MARFMELTLLNSSSIKLSLQSTLPSWIDGEVHVPRLNVRGEGSCLDTHLVYSLLVRSFTKLVILLRTCTIMNKKKLRPFI
jgi:hypothetical protein